MNGVRDDGDGAVSAAERAEAEALRDALEKRPEFREPEDEVLAAARLLQAVGEAALPDDLAFRRLRRDLVAKAGRRPRRAALWAALSSAAALAIAAVLVFGRSGRAPTADVLAAREAEAREALARVGTASAPVLGDADVSGLTLAALSRARTAEVFHTLESERFALTLSGPSSAARPLDDPAKTPTPGGPS